MTDYELTITLENATYPLAGTWQVYDANDVPQTGEGTSGNAAATVTVKLADGEYVLFTGLPVGTKYTVTESNYPANFQPPVIEYTDATQTVGQGDEDAVTVKNTYNVGALTVKKDRGQQ